MIFSAYFITDSTLFNYNHHKMIGKFKVMTAKLTMRALQVVLRIAKQ